jgi:hypothetical protein
MGIEDLSIDMTYDPCKFSLDSTFNKKGTVATRSP